MFYVNRYVVYFLKKLIIYIYVVVEYKKKMIVNLKCKIE